MERAAHARGHPHWPPGSAVLALQPPPPKTGGVGGPTDQAQEEQRSCCLLAGDCFGEFGLVLQGFRCRVLHVRGTASAIALPAGAAGGRMDPSPSQLWRGQQRAHVH